MFLNPPPLEGQELNLHCKGNLKKSRRGFNILPKSKDRNKDYTNSNKRQGLNEQRIKEVNLFNIY